MNRHVYLWVPPDLPEVIESDRPARRLLGKVALRVHDFRQQIVQRRIDLPDLHSPVEPCRTFRGGHVDTNERETLNRDALRVKWYCGGYTSGKIPGENQGTRHNAIHPPPPAHTRTPERRRVSGVKQTGKIPGVMKRYLRQYEYTQSTQKTPEKTTKKILRGDRNLRTIPYQYNYSASLRGTPGSLLFRV